MKQYIAYRRVFFTEFTVVEVGDIDRQPQALSKARKLSHEQCLLKYDHCGQWRVEKTRDDVPSDLVDQAKHILDKQS